MRYTLKELLEDKKLRAAVAEQAYEKKLDFEDGNGVFALDFRGQSLRLNHRQVYDTLCKLGGEKLLKKLMKGEKSCLTDDPTAARHGVCSIAGTEKYFLLTNAGASKVFASILNGIAGWAKMDKSFDMELVCVNDDMVEEDADTDETDAFDAFVFEEGNGWLCQGQEFTNNNLDAVRNGVLSYVDGKPVFVDAETGNPIYIMQLMLQGEMVSCEALYEMDNEFGPVVGYKYRLEHGGKWGFISPRLVRVTMPVYDEIVAAGTMVAAWTEVEDEDIDLTLSLPAEQKETGVQDIWLLQSGPKFCKVNKLYTPLNSMVLEEKGLEDGSRFYLYQPSTELRFGLFQKCRDYQPGEIHTVRYQKGFVSGPDFEESVPAKALTLEKCLQLLGEPSEDLYLSACVVEPGGNGVGTYIIRKDGYWALADVDVNKAPKVRHLSTPLAYTNMKQPENWPAQLVLLERFGKKGIYHWMREKFIASCEYEKIVMERGVFHLTRHGKTRRMWPSGNWLEETLPQCPKCNTELVKGALYCHMCGVSLTEPEKKEQTPEPKPEPVPEPIQESPKPVEKPKPVEPPKAMIKVPTKHNFKDNYIRQGRSSHVSHGCLTVYTQYNEKREEETHPEYYLYGDESIYYYENNCIGKVVEGLNNLAAYALGDEGIFYAKNNEIWYLTTDGSRCKLGEQKNIIGLTDEGNGKLTVEYVESYRQTVFNRYEDRDYYEVWYDEYDVNTKKITLNY